MNILVTGGCGFIGSHFIRHILKRYQQAYVVNLDALTYAAHPDTSTELISSFGGRYEFIHANIASSSVEGILTSKRIDTIVNFAAETHVDRSILDSSTFVTTNIAGVQNLLHSARQHGNVRLIHVSTDEVYGSLKPLESSFHEGSALSPNSPYAASKAASDLLILASYRTYGQNVVITRCSNNFGPYQFPEKLVPLVIANALEGKPIPVYGDGKQVRDWIFVEDHCRAIVAVLESGKNGEIYNISAHEEHTNLDVIRNILGYLGKSDSLITFVGDRPAHDRRYSLNSNKIREHLLWHPEVTFRKGLEDTIEWYCQHTHWWKKVRGTDYFAYYEANYGSKFGASTARGVNQ